MENCSNCQWHERIDGKNEIIGCGYDETLHNAEDACINWLPLPLED